MSTTAVLMRPILNRVLVRPDETEARSAGGIYIPDVAQEKAKRGTVLAVGPGKRTTDGALIPMEVRVGDEVLWRSEYNAVEVKIDGEKLLVLNEDDLLGVVV